MVEISVDEGLLYYNMYGFSNQDGETIEPVTGGANSISYGYIAAGQTLTGTVTLPVPRQDVTLILSDGLGQALSALPIHS
jgi:hypothetical protein